MGHGAPLHEKERAMDRKMVKVSADVRSGTARFRVSVQARSIRQALGLVGARYPQGEVGVVFPIEPEGFFVDGRAPAGIAQTRYPKEIAA
jgi:hypothetical protein